MPGATWRAGMLPCFGRNNKATNEAVSYDRDLCARLLRHLMDSIWLLADSPLHFCSVGSCITFLSGGWCRADRQAGRHSPALLYSSHLPLSSFMSSSPLSPCRPLTLHPLCWLPLLLLLRKSPVKQREPLIGREMTITG